MFAGNALSVCLVQSGSHKHFNCGIPVVAKVLQTLAVSFLKLSGEDESVRPAIISTILDGVLNKIVEDKND